jgi:predicted CXXCH cytochrome family protein
MPTRFPFFLALALVVLFLLGPGCPAGAEKKGKPLGPIAASGAKSTHGPYAAGACDACHARSDPDDPGPAKATNDVCIGCHEEFSTGTSVRLDRSTHPIDGAPCIGCHNPHNARKPKLQM